MSFFTRGSNASSASRSAWPLSPSRLPRSLHPEALAADGTPYAEIDGEWIQWRRTSMLDTKRWCKAAHDYAVGGQADKRRD
jgi:hypothetical protein